MNIGIVLPNWIGDVVMATPALRAVRERFADAHLVGIMRPYVGEVLAGTPWLDEQGNLGGTIAVKDHGSTAFIFEDEKKTPLGVNMAVRRSLVERIGGFRPDLGRSGKSLLGQEQAEFFYRSRQAGAKGLYVPAMVLEHQVPAARLTWSYFRRWWYWKGVSHARLHRIHNQTELGRSLSAAPRAAARFRAIAISWRSRRSSRRRSLNVLVIRPPYAPVGSRPAGPRRWRRSARARRAAGAGRTRLARAA